MAAGNVPFPCGALFDPAQILCFLDDSDLDVLKSVSRATSRKGFVFTETRFAKLDSRPTLPITSWNRNGIAFRGLRRVATETENDLSLLTPRPNSRLWERILDVLLVPPTASCSPPVVQSQNLSEDEFEAQYEAKNVPVVITGITKSWAAEKTWTLQLRYGITNPQRKSWLERFPDETFRYDDNHGEVTKLRHYLEYIRTTADDSPLGIYDSQFGEQGVRKTLLQDYEVPSYFAHERDIFNIGAESRTCPRPPWRWILVGTARSGTELHIDPLGTSAWVTLLQGQKRWCMFPPNTDTSLLGGLSGKCDDDTHVPEAIHWFMMFHPNVPCTDSQKSTSWPAGVSEPLEILQNPGDTVFVPANWPHVVMNLSDTMTITHNYASRYHFESIANACLESEPEFAAEWLPACAQHGMVMETP